LWIQRGKETLKASNHANGLSNTAQRLKKNNRGGGDSNGKQEGMLLSPLGSARKRRTLATVLGIRVVCERGGRGGKTKKAGLGEGQTEMSGMVSFFWLVAFMVFGRVRVGEE